MINHPIGPRECERCGQDYYPSFIDGHYICDECRDEDASARKEERYERSHRMGPL
jgi:hypothetical protein